MRPAPKAPLGSVFDGLPRGIPGIADDAQQLPVTEFGKPEAVLNSPAFSFDRSKVFLGVLGGEIVETPQGKIVRGGTPVGYGDDRHIVMCAGSRAGKGRSCLIPTLLTYGGSVLALDPKGELADITARARREMGQKVFVVDPFGVTKARKLGAASASYNPMMLLRKESSSIIEDAGLIADALVPAEAPDPHWDDSARTLIEGLLMHIATDGLYAGGKNLETLRSVLMGRGPQEVTGEGENGGVPKDYWGRLHAAMARNAANLADKGFEKLGDAIEGAANDFFDRPTNERGSVLSTARRHTKFLEYPPLLDTLRSSDFNLRDLKSDPNGVTVYLCLPASRMGTCSRWFRVFINLLLYEMEEEKAKPAIPMLAVLEEFNVLGPMKQLEIAAGMMAGFGMKMLIVLQDLTQLKRHYKDGWETFLGNAGTMIFFGNSDLTTLEFVSKRCGTTSLTIYRGSQVTTAAQKGGQTGKSWSIEVREVLTPEEVGRFFSRGQLRLLLVRPAGPTSIVLQRAFYDQHEIFAGKWDAP